MKSLAVVCLLSLVALSMAKPNSGRGCIYINGRCSKECPVGTHAYAVGCDHIIPEATCDVPEPVKDLRGMICDYSSCYCDHPTVRDKKSGKCVPLKECPKKE